MCSSSIVVWAPSETNDNDGGSGDGGKQVRIIERGAPRIGGRRQGSGCCLVRSSSACSPIYDVCSSIRVSVLRCLVCRIRNFTSHPFSHSQNLSLTHIDEKRIRVDVGVHGRVEVVLPRVPDLGNPTVSAAGRSWLLCLWGGRDWRWLNDRSSRLGSCCWHERFWGRRRC